MHELPTSEQQVDGLHAYEYGTPYLLLFRKLVGESSVCVFLHDMIMPHSLLSGLSHAPHRATVVTVSLAPRLLKRREPQRRSNLPQCCKMLQCGG